MSKNIRLLIVEDDSVEIKTWQMQIEQHNAVATATDEFQITPTYVETRHDALSFIANADFDAAVVDIGLATGQKHKEANTDGNDVVAALESSELAVVFVFTGQPSDVKKSLNEKVRVIVKGSGETDGFAQILQYLKDETPMIFAVRSAVATIKSEMANLFSRSIWPRWKFWLDGKADPDLAISAAITRHLASHVYAVLMEKGEHKALSEEWYFIPPIREGLRTGDLIELKHFIPDSKEIAVVITPRCDLSDNSGNKNETFQLATCENVSEEWEKRTAAVAAAIAGGDEKKIDSETNRLRALTQHRSVSNFHFLPQMKMTGGNKLGPFLVRFDKVHSFPRKIDAKPITIPDRLASISPEFLPSLVERLGAFFSRIGTPDYSFYK